MEHSPELRKDPSSGRWTIVHKKPVSEENKLDEPESEEGNRDRPKRERYMDPTEYLIRERLDFQQNYCVFSKQFSGRKRQEKEAIFGLRWRDDQVEITYRNWHDDDWEVMVVRTDYAQVVPERTHVLLGEDPFVAEAGFGIHELIVEDPTEDHLPLGVMDVKRTQLILLAVLYRLKGEVSGYPKLEPQKMDNPVKPLFVTEGVRHVSFFHNHRPEAGGSQEHPHSQIIASSIIPTEVSAELEHALRRQEQPPRRCVYCEIVEAERAIREQNPTHQRVLFETTHFLAVQPYSSIYPFETWLIPKRHNSSFTEIITQVQGDDASDKTELEDLASLINDVLGRLYACLDDPAYNLILKTAPVARPDEASKYASFHWHIRIEPRGVTIPGGYELSTGIFSSPTPPEETNAFLQNWGILDQTNAHKDGTLAWYLRISQKAAETQLISMLEAFARESYADSPSIFHDVCASLPKELEQLVNSNLPEVTREDEHFHQVPFDVAVTDLICLLHSGKLDRKEIRPRAQTILTALKYAPIKLRNITKILDPCAKHLRGFASAKVWCRKVERSNPDLFLTQSQSPPESSQRLQRISQAGGYDGPHYRRCPATGRWVLIPSEARRRSIKKLNKDKKDRKGPRYLPRDSKKACPFCNSEERNKNELRLVIKRTASGWEAKDKPKPTWNDTNICEWFSYVIKNINPHLTEKEPHTRPLITGVGPFESIDGQGISDVIVVGGTTPDSDPKLWKKDCHNYIEYISSKHLANAFRALCFRINCIKRDLGPINPSLAGLWHLTVFSNHRAEAGAKVSHVNWQLIATPIVPTEVQRELEHGRRYAEEYFGRCCFCDMIQAEEEHDNLVKDKKNKARLRRGEMLGTRIIPQDSRQFVVLAPYASRSPFEVWIMPRDHATSIELSLAEESDETETGIVTNTSAINELAKILSNILRKLHYTLEDPAYSMLIQNAPIPVQGDEPLYRHYHWRIIIETQRLAIPAGYEHLTGIWSNVVAPEEAARVLKKQYTETTGT